MNYEDMSDFEINSAVHNRVKRLGYDLEFLGCDRIKWSKRGADDVFTGKVCYSKNTVTDYCNNWDDAGTVILENRIGIETTALSSEWMARTCSTNMSNMTFRCHKHKNPLRAAMIVYLMMKDEQK